MEILCSVAGLAGGLFNGRQSQLKDIQRYNSCGNVQLQLVADAGNNLMSRRKILDVSKSPLAAGVNVISHNNRHDEGLTVGELWIQIPEP